MTERLLRRAFGGLAFAALALVPAQAIASVYLFTLSGNATATFSLDSSPSPTASGTDDFSLSSIACTVNGTAGSCDLIFYDALDSGGFDLNGNGSLSLAGSQLFTGTTSSPTFVLGTFPLSTFGSNDLLYSLTISEVSGAVPEPATWTMIMLGFAAIGFAARRRILNVA